MPPVTTTIRLLSDDPSPAAIPGATVSIYTADTTTVVTTGTTDTNGEANFSLPDGTYDVRLYLLGMSVLPRQPQRIVVDHLLVGTIFTITGHLITRPESMDPRLCRITGSFIGPDGDPIAEAKISVIPVAEIAVIGRSALLPQMSMSLSSDQNGNFDFTLLRGVNYRGYITLVDGILLQVPLELDLRVPDAPALDFVDLIFPIPVSATFSAPTISILLADGVNTDLTCEVVYSDGSTRTTPPPWVSLSVYHTDSTVDDTALLTNVVSITPAKTGVDTISVLRIIQPGTLFLPTPAPFDSGTLAITVA